MQKIEKKAQKKLSLGSETIRDLKAGNTSPALAPTYPPGCLVTY